MVCNSPVNKKIESSRVLFEPMDFFDAPRVAAAGEFRVQKCLDDAVQGVGRGGAGTNREDVGVIV
jgi:hypothetical protein